ncbi:putative RNA methylase [Mycobacteroides chelonae]|nr:putative RNA methylase [Mycobacteroides chelonae]
MEEDKPAWNIGAPQPEYAALVEEDGVAREEVLDAGGGYAELALAARGHTVVGLSGDISHAQRYARSDREA